ncbi:hypothetical protein C8A01DRAFT_31547 [Parachaetomium inaequale]|uniref:Uncharacterized protein n=1 Tax=Parachaetomium inaequale TaxID=2588326 RepID=A0AAN6PS08_9PEZI|nr:hypothetical protein C8A01DRAFT_31547 [Parachaetomium inaequale]
MCHVCERLGIAVEGPPPGLIEQENAEEEYLDRKKQEYYAALRAQGIPSPIAPRKHLRSRGPYKVVVEPAPSHDGAPTFAAWGISVSHLDDADSNSKDYYSGYSPPKQAPERHRPPFGIRVYDTTADATAERAALLARRISELTDKHRTSCDGTEKDRIEVVALPLPASTTADERAIRCIAHNKAERAVRLATADAAVAASWYVPGDFAANGTRKRIWVINDLEGELWEDGLRKVDGLQWTELRKEFDPAGVYGHFLAVSYDVDPGWYDGEDEDEDSEEPVPPRPDFFVREQCLEWLGDEFFNHRHGNLRDLWTAHFIADGVLDMELALARAAAAGEEVPRPVVIPCVHEEPAWKKAWKEGKLPFATYPPADFASYT